MILVLGALALGIVFLFWKELKLFTFDQSFAHSVGLQTAKLETILLMTLVVGIVIGIQAVGVVLMISLLIAPASAARQWTHRMSSMVILAAIFGSSSCVCRCGR